jgi:hypothetical protein
MTTTKFLNRFERYLKTELPNHHVTIFGYKLYVDFVFVHMFEEEDVKQAISLMEPSCMDDGFNEDTIFRGLAMKFIDICKHKGIIK